MEKITVTTPLLPELKDFLHYLEDIWDRKWLTNNGFYHQKLEQELCNHLGVKYISLFTNGTLALVAAMQALELKGEVITTPYSFVATSHAVMLNNLTPVFVDIEPNTFNIDPLKIEEAITDKTCAILPVHVYGNPCNHEAIKSIADKYNLNIIYDAAHAFSVKKDNYSVLNWGDLSILSFHATKAYSTIEGGAIICHSLEMKQKIDKLKSFGFDSEIELSQLGTNGKMSEIQAAFGLANLRIIDSAIDKRKKIAKEYREKLKNIDGISFVNDIENVEHNYSYFPILVDEKIYGMTRDELFEKLKENNILARRYFYPLITDFDFYQNSDIAIKSNLAISRRVSDNVICLPIHHELTIDDVIYILSVIESK